MGIETKYKNITVQVHFFSTQYTEMVTTTHAVIGCIVGAIFSIFVLVENKTVTRMLAQMDKRWESIVENKIKPLFVEDK